MRHTLTTVLLATTVSTIANADVYLEVGFASGGPNGGTEGELAMLNPAPLSIWIWADEPGLTIMNLFLQINGQSKQGFPNSGGILTFDSIGTADPNSNFVIFATDGTLNTDNTLINNIGFSNLTFPATPLPTSIDNAWLIYTDFTGTAQNAGAGVMPIVTNLTFQGTTPQQTIHTFGLYETPTPSTLALLGLASLGITKRRR